MSGKDETDLVNNKFESRERSTENSSKSDTLDQIHDHSNGDSTAVNGDSLNESPERSKQTIAESTPKSSAPSNWVKFENEDDSDTVYKH